MRQTSEHAPTENPGSPHRSYRWILLPLLVSAGAFGYMLQMTADLIHAGQMVSDLLHAYGDARP